MTMVNPGTTNLVAWWRMHEQSGTRYDAHGTNDCTGVYNAPGYGAGKRGKAVDLDGANQALACGDNPNISMGGDVDFCLGFWFKSRDTQYNQRLMGKWDEGGSKEYMVSLYSKRLNFYVRNYNDTTSYNVISNSWGDCVNDVWYCVIAYYRSAVDQIVLSVNDVGSAASGPVLGVRDSDNHLFFGRDLTAGYYLNGMIDEAFIYKNYYLSNDERDWIYNEGHGKTYSDLIQTSPPPIDIVTTPTAGKLMIFVLDSSLNVLSIIEDYYSLTWAERYSEVGDFELDLPIEYDQDSSIVFGNFLYIKSSDALMIIEDIKPEIGEDTASLVVKGQSAESLLKRRVLIDPINVNGRAEIAIYSFIDNHLTDPADTDRRITLLATDFPEMVTTVLYEEQIEMQTVYDAIEIICKSTGLGFRIVQYNDELVFYVYEGKDRSYDQSVNPYVIFAETFDNVISSSFYESIKDKKNITLVATEDSVEALQRVFVWENSEPSDLTRYESILETTIDRDIGDDAPPLTDAEVLAIINTRGVHVIKENMFVGLFEGDFDIQGNFKYGVDFFLGDIVQCDLEGRNVKARVIELVRSYSTEGEKSYVAMDFII